MFYRIENILSFICILNHANVTHMTQKNYIYLVYVAIFNFVGYFKVYSCGPQNINFNIFSLILFFNLVLPISNM